MCRIVAIWLLKGFGPLLSLHGGIGGVGFGSSWLTAGDGLEVVGRKGLGLGLTQNPKSI